MKAIEHPSCGDTHEVKASLCIPQVDVGPMPQQFEGSLNCRVVHSFGHTLQTDTDNVYCSPTSVLS